MANWWLAALAHDTAYGIEILQGTVKLLGYFGNHPAVGEFTKGVQTTIAQLSKGLCELAPELKDDSSVVKGDHGLVTAGHLAVSLRNIGDETRKKYFPAVRAVALHNTKHPMVNAQRDPVAALLILCDTVQNWGRSQLAFARSPAEVLSRIVEGGTSPPGEQFGPVEAFYFSMKALSPKEHGTDPVGWKPRMHAWRDKRALTVRLHFAAWMTKKPEWRERVLFEWADATYNLQRVDFSGWGLDLTLVHRTPYAQSWRGMQTDLPTEERNAPELERFGAMVQEQSAGFVKPWIDAAGESENSSPLSYERFPPHRGAISGWEEVTFHLCALGQRYLKGEPLMAKDTEQFSEVVKNWSKRLVPLPEHRPEQRPPQ